MVGRKISKHPTTKRGRDDADIDLVNDSADWIVYFLGIHILFRVSPGKWGKTPLSFSGRVLPGGSLKLQELNKLGSKIIRAQNSELFSGYLCAGKLLHFSQTEWRNNGACFLSH